MKLQGIFPPIATPFDHNGSLYVAKVQHNVEKWNRTTLAGYVVCDATGESGLLTREEKVAVWEHVAQYAAPEKLLIAGSGAESVRETVCLASRAAELGYRAALVPTPHHDASMMRRTETQMLYYRAVADQSRLPLLIGNAPRATGVDLPAEAVAELSRHPNIIGILEDSGDLGKIMRVLRETEAGFHVLTGSAQTLWPALLMGASGAVLAFANAAPYAAIAIWEAFRTREEEAARDWQNRIARAAVLVTEKYGVPGLKHAMDLNGYYGGPPRLPLAVPMAAAKAEIAAAFQDIKG